MIDIITLARASCASEVVPSRRSNYLSMKNLVSATLFGVAVILGLSNQPAQSAAVPAVVNWEPFIQLEFVPKSQTGPDGNNRFLWDYFDVGSGTYQGSVLWILDPTGNVIGTGDAMIPATVGGFSGGTSIGSDTLFHVNSDNSTTVAFAFIGGGGVGSFGTWTYNAQGKLIAFSGPTGFSPGLQIANLEFQKDFLVVTFIPAGQPIIPTLGVGPYTVWVLDHFGNLVSAVGAQGPYNGYVLGSVSLSGESTGAPNQLWHWLIVPTSGPERFGLAVQEFSPSGAALSGFNYGPF
jgi:hypothetical protein